VRVIKTGRQFNVQSAPLSASLPITLRRESSGIDIAHIHSPYPPGEAANLWFGRANKTVITWHSDIVRQKTLLRYYAPTLRRVIKKANRILPTSDIYASSSAWLSPHLDKCTAVPLSVDVARFQPAVMLNPRAATIRERILATSPNGAATTVLLTVGRLRYYKGIDDLIRAMPQLPDALYVVAGTGPMIVPWKQLAKKLGVAGRVVFVGDVSDADLPVFYQAADIYVLPANVRAEAFGVAILEAMASGLPIVSTDVGTATSWVNQHDITGLVVPPLHPAALAASIQKLQNSPFLRRQMGLAGRQRVLDEFTIDKMIQRIDDVYRQLLAG
jgi:glycosyltransferase involved in cell wall biosynthesis